jgi:hypothetical protein
MRSLSDSTEQPGHSRVQRLGKCVDGCDPATLWRGFHIVLHREQRPVANTTILELVDYARYNENFVLVVTSSFCIRWNSAGYQGRSPWLVRSLGHCGWDF